MASIPANVLIVEDHPDVAHIEVELLQSAGYNASLVHSARDALDFLASHSGINIVFSDIRLGQETGVWLAEKVSILYPQIVIVLQTGYASAAIDHPIKWPVIMKPFGMRSLVKVFDEELSKKSTASEGA